MGKYKGILSKRTKTFKQTIAPISRYKRIKAALESAHTEPYTTFCTFISQDFDTFLVPFPNNQPMMHTLYPAMCKLVSGIMSKFIKKRVLSKKKKKKKNEKKDINHKSLKYINIGDDDDENIKTFHETIFIS